MAHIAIAIVLIPVSLPRAAADFWAELGVIPIGLGIVPGCFSLITLAFARPLLPPAGSV